jgi:surfeit locus 1 family protein
VPPLFSRRWILTTLLALAAVGVLIRLGIWQLDRLSQRRAFNASVIAQQTAAPLALDNSTLSEDLGSMEYRAVIVTGTYDHAQQVILRNQVWQTRPGVHLLTPLVISGTNRAVLVDRGWIPSEDSAPDKRGQYDEPGIVTVRGVLRRPQTRPDFGGVPDPPLAPGQTRLDAWNIINVERISQQVNVPMLAAYIQQSSGAAQTAPPYPSEPQLDLTEGPHFSYALQWFTFAAILAVGYPVYVRRQSSNAKRQTSTQGNKA